MKIRLFILFFCSLVLVGFAKPYLKVQFSSMSSIYIKKIPFQNNEVRFFFTGSNYGNSQVIKIKLSFLLEKDEVFLTAKKVTLSEDLERLKKIQIPQEFLGPFLFLNANENFPSMKKKVIESFGESYEFVFGSPNIENLVFTLVKD